MSDEKNGGEVDFKATWISSESTTLQYFGDFLKDDHSHKIKSRKKGLYFGVFKVYRLVKIKNIHFVV